MKDTNETVLVMKEEGYVRKLAKRATLGFTSGAATVLGAFAAVVVLSALSRNSDSTQESNNQESNEVETTE